LQPGVEEASLGVFAIVAADDTEIFPATAVQRETAQRAGLEPDQETEE
jgi:hypothetical protein